MLKLNGNSINKVMINNYRDNYEGIFTKTPDPKNKINPKIKEEILPDYQEIQEYLDAEGIDRPTIEVVREASAWFAKEIELLNDAEMAIYHESVAAGNTHEEAIAAVRK